MEGLGAAASGIAVVSLAIQLIDSIREIRAFLHSVRDAPKELKRLLDLLEQLEIILETISSLIEQQRKRQLSGDIDVSPSVLKAVERCKDKLSSIESAVEVAKRSVSSTNKTSRGLGRFRLACKKSEIEEFEAQLQNALGILNLTMSTNLMAINFTGLGRILEEIASINQPKATSSKELVAVNHSLQDTHQKLLEGSCGVLSLNEHPKPFPTKISTVSRREETTSSIYNSVIGKIVVRRARYYSKDEKEKYLPAPSSCESTWVFMPYFLSFCWEFEFRKSAGFIQRSIRTYPVISDQHEVWDFCRNGNLAGVQALINGNKISPFSINSTGWTLLHFAVNSLNPELCQIFMSYGLTGYERNDLGLEPMFIKINTNAISIGEFYSQLYSPRQDYDISEFCPYLFYPFQYVKNDFSFQRIQAFNSLVHRWVTRENIMKFLESPISICLRFFMIPDPNPTQSCAKLLRHLLALLPDKFSTEEPNYTAFGVLFDWGFASSPYESLYLGDSYLSLLRDRGININDFLETEKDQYQKKKNQKSPWRINGREIQLLFLEGPEPRVMWDWYTRPDSNAYEVLEEFKYFKDQNLSCLGKIDEWKETWPYDFSDVWECLTGKAIWMLEDDWEEKKRLITRRYEWRQYKKEMKAARAQKLPRGPKMPGAWIE